MESVTGTVVATGAMCDTSSFAITSATYGPDCGMLFVALSSGTVQAFDAATLDSLWIYQDMLGGQPNCPLTYHDGYVYTGFWNQEQENANFVCLSATDENPTSGSEKKLAAGRIPVWAASTGRVRMSATTICWWAPTTDRIDPPAPPARCCALTPPPARSWIAGTACGATCAAPSPETGTDASTSPPREGYLYSAAVTQTADRLEDHGYALLRPQQRQRQRENTGHEHLYAGAV